MDTDAYIVGQPFNLFFYMLYYVVLEADIFIYLSFVFVNGNLLKYVKVLADIYEDNYAY